MHDERNKLTGECLSLNPVLEDSPLVLRDGPKAEDESSRVLDSYPRDRKPLTPQHRAIYVDEYRSNRMARRGLSRIVGQLESWMHRKIAASRNGGSVLELGAGTLNHLQYEPLISTYDVVEPFRELWEDSPYRSRVTAFYNDIAEVPVENRYDRIISVAVLEHLTDLPLIVARSAAYLSDAGAFQAGIPSEGGLLWGLAWRSTTGVAYRLRTGLKYATVMQHEHVNTAAEIEAVASYFFKDVVRKRFPLPFAHLSFYTVIEASRPRMERCRQYCAARELQPTHDDRH